jgi:hypothetical protein
MIFVETLTKNKYGTIIIDFSNSFFSYNKKMIKGVNKNQEIITFSDVTTYELAKNKLHNNNIELSIRKTYF